MHNTPALPREKLRGSPEGSRNKNFACKFGDDYYFSQVFTRASGEDCMVYKSRAGGLGGVVMVGYGSDGVMGL